MTRSIDPGKDLNQRQKDKIVPNIALTEVVHCKSRKEEGVEEAVVECYKKHTRAVIEEFLKSSPEKTKKQSSSEKKVVVMGNHAQYTLAQGILAESLLAKDPDVSSDILKNELKDLKKELEKLKKEELEKELKRYAQDGFGALGENAHFIFIPHPVAPGFSYAECQRRIDRQYKPPRQ